MSNIKYSNHSKGAFDAVSNFNGLKIEWYSWDFFPYNKLNVDKFYAVRRSHCYGKDDRCEIECIYTAEKELSFSLRMGNDYLSDDVGSGNWFFGNGRCEDIDPVACVFYISPHN